MRLLLWNSGWWRGNEASWLSSINIRVRCIHYRRVVLSASLITNLVAVQLKCIKVKLRVFLSRSLVWRWSVVETSSWAFKSTNVIGCCVLIQAWSCTVRCCCKQCTHLTLVQISRLSSALLSFLAVFLAGGRTRRFPWDALLNKLFLITIINEIYDVVCASYETVTRFKSRVEPERIPLPFFLLSSSFFLFIQLFFLLPFLCLLSPDRILSYIFDGQLPF